MIECTAQNTIKFNIPPLVLSWGLHDANLYLRKSEPGFPGWVREDKHTTHFIAPEIIVL